MRQWITGNDTGEKAGLPQCLILKSSQHWQVLNGDVNLDHLGKKVSSRFIHCKVIIFPSVFNKYLVWVALIFLISHIRNSLCFTCTSTYNLHLGSTGTSRQLFPRSLGFHVRLRCLTMRQRHTSSIWTLSAASYKSLVQTSVK